MSLGLPITYLSFMSFLDVVTDLLADPAAKDAYQSDPQGWLNEQGYGDLSPTELDRAMVHSSDALSPDVARALGPNPSLDSAASLDMEAAGLSLERPGLDETDADETDLDAVDAVDALDADDTAFDFEEPVEVGADAEADAAVTDTDSPAEEFSSATDDAELTDTTPTDSLDDQGLSSEANGLGVDYETDFEADLNDLDDLDGPDDSFDGLS